MKGIHVFILVVAVVISFAAGGAMGFLLGVASTDAGSQFLEDMVEQEQQAEVGSPKTLKRKRFKLLYPANWKIDVADEDYDPDSMFSIDSPGSSYVLFMLGNLEVDPDSAVKDQIDAFTRLMGTPSVERFESYGKLQGKGAVLKGRIMGVRTTVKVFCCYLNGVAVIIVQQYPDEDLKYVKDGLLLIENSFVLQPSILEK